MIFAEVETAAGTWIGCDFLIDSGADVTVISPAVLQQLGRPTTPAAHQLGGIGGSIPTLEVWTTIRFRASDGSVANIGGTRSAFGVTGAISDCILGLDLLGAFVLIADRPNDILCLLRPPRKYTITGSSFRVPRSVVLQTPVGRVRAAGLVEGVSALILFFIAMPLKYAPPAGSETAAVGKQVVFWVGAIHGGLFVAYALITFAAWGTGALRFKHVAMAAAASIVPFGPFVIDRKLKAYEESRPDTAGSAG